MIFFSLCSRSAGFFIVYTWIMTTLTPIFINTGKTHQWDCLILIMYHYTAICSNHLIVVLLLYDVGGRWPLLVSPPIIFSIPASLLHIAFFKKLFFRLIEINGFLFNGGDTGPLCSQISQSVQTNVLVNIGLVY